MSPFLKSVTQVESGFAGANWKIVNQYNGQVFVNHNYCNNLREALDEVERFESILYEEWAKDFPSKKDVPNHLMVAFVGSDPVIYNNKSFWQADRKVVQLKDILNRVGLE